MRGGCRHPAGGARRAHRLDNRRACDRPRKHMKVVTRSDRPRPQRYIPSMELVAGVLSGSKAAIARMITRAEGGYSEAVDALAEIYRHTGKAHIIGITGVPGAGKSTL